MRKPIIIANWKLNHHAQQANEFLTTFYPLVESITNRVDIGIAPGTPILAILQQFQQQVGDSQLLITAQNASQHEQGAYTGEASLSMLASVRVKYVIIGHSERRSIFHENNQIIAEKLAAVFAANMTPVLCIGETLAERENNQVETVLSAQIDAAFDCCQNLSNDILEKTVIAYEPIWAIGTGKTATVAQAQTTHAFIRNYLASKWQPEVADKIRLQYGGSVKPENSKELLSSTDIDGALVGGASLDPASFAAIIANA